jgi:hypothetical protein
VKFTVARAISARATLSRDGRVYASSTVELGERGAEGMLRALRRSVGGLYTLKLWKGRRLIVSRRLTLS